MNPYELLGLDKHCSGKDITKAYRELSKRFHPDVGGDPEMFSRISAAVEILRDPIRRKLFDAHGIYMEESTETLKSMATGKFMELLGNWMNVTLQSDRDINLPKYLISTINQVEDNIHQTERNINDMVNKLTKRLKQCTFTGDRNILKELIDQKLMELSTARQTNERDKIILKMVKEECLKYSSIEDPVVMQSSVFGGTFGSTTTNTIFTRY